VDFERVEFGQAKNSDVRIVRTITAVTRNIWEMWSERSEQGEGQVKVVIAGNRD
jgi:hypothetical protein